MAKCSAKQALGGALTAEDAATTVDFLQKKKKKEVGGLGGASGLKKWIKNRSHFIKGYNNTKI